MKVHRYTDTSEKGHGLEFGIRVLRGLAQVMFLESAWSGAVFALALCTADWRYGAYGLGGAALGTGTACLLGVTRERVRAGLEGFNSCLTALCLAVFLDARRPATALLAVVACLMVTVVTAAVVQLLHVWDLPTLTLPYCLLAGAVTVAAPAFQRIWSTGESVAVLPRAASGPTVLRPYDVAGAFLRNLSQVFFMDQWYAGALLLAGLFLASRTAGWVACCGSATGILTAWALGAPAARIADGTLGYNAVLVALALCGVFLPATRATLLYALLGAATATALTPAAAALLAPSGGRPFTWPFVLTALGFLMAARRFPRITGPTTRATTDHPAADPPRDEEAAACRQNGSARSSPRRGVRFSDPA
ncbi:urea transporter [Streptomyces fodineus]|uniref:Urea transporter n=1 Tax=Streptomyces fodineus TaxID=1904616 RepID=A0A1D7Y361_9ACTN|nr:urea transporter [Streptomyces fodineus]AOR30022.1 urea transporter [Streptomyces fodineus]